MTDTLELRGFTVHIPNIEDFSYDTLLTLLLAEYERVRRFSEPPEGAFQHVVVLPLENEFLSLIDDHMVVAGAKVPDGGGTPWSRHQCKLAEEAYVVYLEQVCDELTTIAYTTKKRTKQQKRRRQPNGTDLTIARMLVAILDAVDDLELFIEDRLTS